MAYHRELSVEDICRKLQPLLGSKIDDLYMRYTLSQGREERDEIVHILNILYQKHLVQLLDKGVLLEPPKLEDMNGSYELAKVSYAGKNLGPFNLREKDWQRHVCITGMSGSGKTTLAFGVIEELTRNNKNFLVFDWKKSFRPLLSKNQNLMLFTVGDESTSNLFKVNINQPPKGIAPKEWITTLVDLLAESFMVSFGVHKILLETLDETFKEWGVYNGSENYPTWNNIKWSLEEKLGKTKQTREAGWIESALRIATVLTFGEFGKVVNYKGEDSVSVEKLLETQTVMELNALGNVEKKFFCEFLLMYIHRMKKAGQNEVSHGFEHAIIVDEAHNIFLKKPTTFANESVTDMIYREMREYGTSLICLDQHISKISDTVTGNSACHIAFQQQLPADIDSVSSLMQLRDYRNYFSDLKVGQAIVRLSERYTSPFLVNVPYIDTRSREFSNDQVKGRMDSFFSVDEFKKGEDAAVDEELVNGENSRCHYIVRGEKFFGVHDKLSGDTSKLKGDASRIYGEATGTEGDVSKVKGSVTNIFGDVSFISGDLKGLMGDVTMLRGDVTNLEGDVALLTKKYTEVKGEGEEKKIVESIDEGTEEIVREKLVGEEQNISENQTNISVSLESVDDLLYDYITTNLEKGYSLGNIEKVLEDSQNSGPYTSQDIVRVINKVFDEQLNGSFKKDKSIVLSLQSSEEQVFMEFLRENPNHNLSTVELYRELGLSARKGTNTKNGLIEKGLLKVEEIRYDKGWKKLLRLNS